MYTLNTSLSACRMWNHLEAEVTSHSLPSHQKQIQAELERQDRGAEPQCKNPHKFVERVRTKEGKSSGTRTSPG